MLKSVRIIAFSAVFLLLGWTVPVGAWQEKQEEKAEPARQEQQAKPERQQQAETPRPQQQAKPEHQQQAKAPQDHQQAKPEKQQQAKGQQDQQHQQHQLNSARRQSQQTDGGQHSGHQQAASSQRPERTEQAMAAQRAQPALRLSSRGSARIPDERFHSNFGREHEFHMGNPVMVTGTLGSSMAAIGLDSSNRGRWAGTTPTTSTLITWMADITCSTRTIPALASQSASCSDIRS